MNMVFRDSWIILVLSIILFASASSMDFNVVDLTHIHNNESTRWGVDLALEFTINYRGLYDSHWYEDNTFKTVEHYGTHLDSPSHMYKGSWRVHQIPISHLVGPGVIINVKHHVERNSDYRVTIADIKAWEAQYGQIPDGAVIIMNSGWSERYPNRQLVFNSATPDDSSTYHFPSWHENTVNWLVRNRNVHVVGVDTPSVDYGQSTNYPVHVLLGSNNILAIENVANLDDILPTGSIIVVGVMKLEDGSGCPARVIALVKEGKMKGRKRERKWKGRKKERKEKY